MAARMTMAAAAAAMMMIGAPVAARGHHGFHSHRGGFGFHHARTHCRTFKDQNGIRQRVCA